MVKSEDFHFTRHVIGFETFDKGELIAMNGDEEIRSPCDRCTIFMPTRMPIVGREAVYHTEAIKATWRTMRQVATRPTCQGSGACPC